MSIFEALMLLCFGISWPFSIAKSLKSKSVKGKSPLFLTIVCLGYVSGVIHKLTHGRDWVTLLYAANMLMVGFDLILYIRYARKEESASSEKNEDS